MPLCGVIFGILLVLLQNNIRLRIMQIGNLIPKQRYRPSNLDKCSDLRFDIELVTIDITDLLNFHKVSDVTV